MILPRTLLWAAAAATLLCSFASAQTIYRVGPRGAVTVIFGSPSGISMGDEMVLRLEFRGSDLAPRGVSPHTRSECFQFLSQEFSVRGIPRPSTPVVSQFFTGPDASGDGSFSTQVKVSGNTGVVGANYWVSSSQAVHVPDILDPLSYNGLNYAQRGLEYREDSANIAIAQFGTFSASVVVSNQAPSADAGPNVEIDSADQASTLLAGTASDPDPGDTLTCRWLEGTTVLAGPTTLTTASCVLDLGTLAPFSLGEHTLTLEISDGTVTVTDDMILAVANSAPTAAPSGSGCYEIGAATGITLSADVADFDGDLLSYEWREQGATGPFAGGVVATLAGGAATPLPSAWIATTALGLGIHVLELAVDDGVNAEVVASIEVEVKDTTGPTLALVCSQTILWPPNHRMVAVTVDTNAADEGGPVTVAASVASNEPLEGTGEGDIAPDWSGIDVDPITGQVTFDLRAERSGSGSGRVYTLTITATDSSGNVSIASCDVVVPKSQGRNR